MKKDDIKTLIVVLIVSIVCIFIILLLSTKKNIDKLEDVEEYSTYFSAVNYVNNYINNASSDNKNVYYLLDSSFIDYNSITYEDVLEKIDVYPVGSSVSMDTIKYLKKGNNFVYYITGKIFQNDMDSKIEIDNDFKIIIAVDMNSLSFSVYPVTSNNYKKVINSIKSINIDNNDYNNVIISELVTKEQICILYMQDFINKLNDNIELSYGLLSNNMMTYEYASSLESYKTYITNNISKISTVADKCLLEKIGDERIYTVIDKNKNKFIFKEDSVLQYKVTFYLSNEEV